MGLLSCAMNQQAVDCNTNNSCLKPWGNSHVNGTSSPMKFNYALDEFITAKDPRIQSLINITKANDGASLEITYPADDSKALSTRLYNIFKSANTSVNIPQKLTATDQAINVKLTYVLVVIKFNLSPTKINSSNVKGN